LSLTLRLRRRSYDVTETALVMGILNVTPDSFYDSGRFLAQGAALARAHAIVAQGAAILDLGGQSYAASSPRIAEEEELRRVLPVVETLVAERLPVALSVDTYRTRVAREVLAAGADLINDCSGLRDSALASVVAEFDAALVVMHLKGELNVREVEKYRYDDPVAEIAAFLAERTALARAAGVAPDSIIIDPGLEFGKEPATDLEILDRFGELRALGSPLLLASSRKSFIGRTLKLPAEELLAPSLATAALGWFGGARIFRVHDVAETFRFLEMLSAVRNRPRLERV
jgi:dihydropteroate synthase